MTPQPPSTDPFDELLKPPEDESPEERELRISHEEEAKRVSQVIDQQIHSERQLLKKKRTVRVLLLGQSESGKSTTLRHFKRLYTPSAFRDERVLWCGVIQLNFVRSVRTILDVLADVQARVNDQGDDESDDEPRISDEIDQLCMRLAPLRHIESLLIAKLVPPNEEDPTHLGDGSSSNSNSSAWRTQEVFVRPGTTWKGALLSKAGRSQAGRPTSAGTTGLETLDENQEALHNCRRDIKQLWADPAVREILHRRKVRLDEHPGFFLDDVDRVTSLRYSPTDDDVLKARLKTVGVSEYKFEMEASAGRENGTDWRLVDVGGSRSQRATWVPFFDTVDAIIFLAPISGFDQVLQEDRSVNRLEDSVLLWKFVCSSKLLGNVDLVLFLNKCDILAKKLAAGVRLTKYIRSYGDRPNDLDNASKYLRGKFSAIHREFSPNPRKFYAFCTSVTDTNTTAGILASVRDMVVRQNLKQSKLL